YASFFIIHYGFLNLAYAFVLFAFGRSGTLFNGGPSPFTATDRAVNIWLVLIAGAMFALHHIISYAQERQSYLRQPPAVALTRLMFAPYFRVIIMHVIIIMGPIIALEFGARWIFVPFMILKT